MVPFLHPPSIQNTLCPHCSGFYTLGGLLRHVKNAHPFASFISQASQVNQVVLSLQVSFCPLFLLGFFPLAFWGWLLAQFNSILGLIHRIP
jgi:hypothetical protein